MLLDHVVRHWWLIALRGLLAVVFGLLALIWPGITLLILAIVFGAYALVDGVTAAVSAARAPRGGRAPLVVETVAGIAFGLVTLFWPGVTVLVLTILVGFWAVITGLTEIITAIRLRQEITGEWLYVLFGAISVIFGLIVLFSPVSGAVAIAWIIGVSAIVFGLTMLAAGFRIRRLAGHGGMGGMGGPAPGGRF